jgi:hypothetical protein
MVPRQSFNAMKPELILRRMELADRLRKIHEIAVGCTQNRVRAKAAPAGLLTER